MCVPHPMPDETPTPSPSSTPRTPSSPAPRWKRVVFGFSLSRVQAVIGTVAGIVSIGGAFVSIVPYARAAPTGELVARGTEAGSHPGVTGATIHGLTTPNALV